MSPNDKGLRRGTPQVRGGLVHSDVDHTNWAASTGPFGAILTTGSSLNARQDAAAVVDAKSVFDTLTRNTAGSSKQDKRTAIELSIIKESSAFGLQGALGTALGDAVLPAYQG